MKVKMGTALNTIIGRRKPILQLQLKCPECKHYDQLSLNPNFLAEQFKTRYCPECRKK